MPTTESSPPTLAPGHIGLNVSDLDRSARFYRAVFAFEVLDESQDPDRRYVFLGVGTQVVLTLWQQSAGRFDPARPGLHHLAFEVPDVERIRAAERTLHALGVSFQYAGIVPHAEGLDSGGVFFEDPDGIRLEIYAAAGAGERPAPVPGAPTCGFF